jgi:hypothetical protein
MAASAAQLATAAAVTLAHQPTPPRRAKRIHDNAATPYLRLEDEILDVIEDVTPLPTDLIKLVVGLADLEGYHVLPRGPIRLELNRAMSSSIKDCTVFRCHDAPADMRSLSFRGGGSLVHSSPLFLSYSRKRKRRQWCSSGSRSHFGCQLRQC